MHSSRVSLSSDLGVVAAEGGKMKTTKGGKVMNPTDAYRKELRKKELKRVRNTNTLAPFPLVHSPPQSLPSF